MGGSKLLDRPANVVILCSNLNYLIEADYDAAKYAIQMGWKLNRNQDPEATPIYDGTKGEWFLLDNDFNRVQLDNR